MAQGPAMMRERQMVAEADGAGLDDGGGCFVSVMAVTYPFCADAKQ